MDSEMKNYEPLILSKAGMPLVAGSCRFWAFIRTGRQN
jgi:hypothetical protein